MTRHLSWLFVALGVLAICGCSTAPLAMSEAASKKQSLFCEVAQNIEKYRGVRIELNARYVSDGKHEEVLEDLSCIGGRYIIDIGRRGNSASVSKFYDARRVRCSERGATYLCNTRAEIELIGKISLMAGEPVFDIEEVGRYVFDK